MALDRFPQGRRLAPREFEARHRGIVVLALIQGIGLFPFALARGFDLGHSLLETLLPITLALLAATKFAPQRVRSVLACIALITESAILVHISGGYIEAHFHFFAMLAVISIYQDYAPFLVAIAFVVVDHGILGTIAPTAVYNHPDAIANPWSWALVHGVFVLAESAALLVCWKVLERAEDRRVHAEARLEVERQTSAQREALARNERLTSLGTLVAGVAHEINNPLTYISGNLELALETAEAGPEGAQMRHMLSTALAGTERVATITRALRSVARTSSGRPRERVEIAQVTRNVQALVESSVPPGIELTFQDDSAHASVEGDPSELHQAVLNLVQNALQAVDARTGKVSVACSRRGDTALVDVVDNGPGIPEDVRAKLFTPFFTTKPQGTGLGLSIVHTIVEAHGGSIRVENEPQAGARFVLAFPLARSSTAPRN